MTISQRVRDALLQEFDRVGAPIEGVIEMCAYPLLSVVPDFLPFRCNKVQQTAARGGTKRRPKIVRFSLRRGPIQQRPAYSRKRRLTLPFPAIKRHARARRLEFRRAGPYARVVVTVRQDYQQAVEGIRQGYEDVKAGRTAPAGQFLDEFARKHGLPR